jgi:hypothetical protein
MMAVPANRARSRLVVRGTTRTECKTRLSASLPDDDGPSPGLFLRTVGAEVCPPKVASPQP